MRRYWGRVLTTAVLALTVGAGTTFAGLTPAYASCPGCISHFTTTIPVGGGPGAVAFTPDGSRSYVAHGGDNTVSVIKLSTNTVVGTILVGRNSFGLAFSPDGAKADVSNAGDNTVSGINVANDTVVATIPVGQHPIGVTFTPNGTKAYVANSSDNTVTVITS